MPVVSVRLLLQCRILLQCRSAGASGRQARPPGLAGGHINVLTLLLCVLW